MKRFILCTTILMAAGALNATEKKEFLEDERNYKSVGLFDSILRTKVLDEKKVEVLINKLSLSLDNRLVIEKALENQQKDNETLKLRHEEQQKEINELKEKLKLSTTQTQFLEESKKNTLIKLNTRESSLVLQEDRNKLLEEENLNLKKIIVNITEREQEINRLLSDVKEQEEMKEIEGLEELAKINRNKIEILKKEKESLLSLKLKKEEDIKSLEKRIIENDYYAQIKNMIENRNVSDDELSLKIYSICNFLNTDLDDLSKGRKRLIQILVKVSKPPESLPKSDERWEKYYGIKGLYVDRFRLLGNLFTPRGLGYDGPLDWEHTKYKGSKFEKKSQELGKTAQKTFNIN
jgi:hypothetical protein